MIKLDDDLADQFVAVTSFCNKVRTVSCHNFFKFSFMKRFLKIQHKKSLIIKTVFFLVMRLSMTINKYNSSNPI